MSKRMTSLAQAMVYAVIYINLRESSDDDDDVGALESIAGLLSGASAEELDALSQAANQAAEDEAKRPNPRDEFLEDYRTWMECLFGDDDWDGNTRRSP